MTLTKKQIITTIFTLAIVFAIPIALYLTQKKQGIRPQALQGKANFLLSTDSITSTAGRDINVLVSLQLTDAALKVSGVDFVLLYDKNLLDVGNIVPQVTSVDASAAFTDAPIVTSGGSFDDTFNYVRVAEVARKQDSALAGGTASAIKLANITFRGRGSGGAATIKFPDDNKYLEVSGIGLPTGPTPIACTLDAKTCPDGSSVGRVAPSCEFAPCSATPIPVAGLFSFWHMNETSGSAVADALGANNGTATGTTIVDGAKEKARSFNGSSDIVTSGSNKFATNTFSIVAMFKTNVTHEIDSESTTGVSGISGEKYLFVPNHGGNANAGMGVSVGTNGISVYEHGSNYLPALAVYNGAVPANTWNHLAVVYENKKPKIYLNGVMVREGLTSTRGVISMPTVMGGFTYGYFNGQLDEVQYYNRALSADEIKILSGVGPTLTPGGPTVTSPPNSPTATPRPPTATTAPAPTSSIPSYLNCHSDGDCQQGWFCGSMNAEISGWGTCEKPERDDR